MKNKIIRKTITIEYDQEIGTMNYNNIILDCIDSKGKTYFTNLNDKSIKNTITQLTKDYNTWIKVRQPNKKYRYFPDPRPKCLTTYTNVEVKMVNGKTKKCTAGEANWYWPTGANIDNGPKYAKTIAHAEEFVKAWRFAK